MERCANIPLSQSSPVEIRAMNLMRGDVFIPRVIRHVMHLLGYVFLFFFPYGFDAVVRMRITFFFSPGGVFKKRSWGEAIYMTARMETRRLSEYEIARLERIKENKKMLEELFPEGTGLHLPVDSERTPEKGITTPSKKTSTRRQLLVNVRCNPSRKARPKFGEAARRPHTRSVSAAKLSLVEGLKDDQDLKRRVYSTRSRRQCLNDKENEALPIELGGLDYDPLTVKEVAQSVKNKTYDKVNGTTCHQCRQKTLDQKTICHNKKCTGVRGQFCGPCLRNRYGECARETLLDATWVCPPCRGICNCSFCLPKKGRPPTGIMIHLAKEAGFDSVREYLEKSRY